MTTRSARLAVTSSTLLAGWLGAAGFLVAVVTPAAFELLPTPVPENVAVVGELPERFGQARRILGFVTERFLFANRDMWFGLGNG